MSSEMKLESFPSYRDEILNLKSFDLCLLISAIFILLMRIKKDIEELLKAEVISPEVAAKIETFYRSKSSSSQSRLLAIFGVIGGLLVGMGIVLIVAHNWDNLSRPFKTFFAFLPLVIAQIVTGFSLWKKMDSTAWREGSSAVLFFAIAACISMVSQIYNVDGELGGFILTWMLLALPIAYIMRSSIVAILCLLGITYLGVETGYFNSYKYPGINWYWVLLPALLPYYIYLHLRQKESNFLTFFNWLIPLSLTICLGLLATNDEEWMLLAYMSLFGLFFIIGNTPWFSKGSLGQNGFKIIGSFGVVCILLGVSFKEVWREFSYLHLDFNNSEFAAFVVLTIAAIVVMVYSYVQKRKVNFKEFVFLAFAVIFLAGMGNAWAVILINILILAIAVLTIKEGNDKEHLGILNYGLLIITALIACRFFDAKLSFVLRGLIFVAVGIGFFLMNYWMLKRRNHGEK